MLLFSLYFICLSFASFLTAYLSASICFLNTTSHDEGRGPVLRFNAHKDYLVCNVGLKPVATMIWEEILKAMFITITFIFSSFAFVSDLLYCTSTLMLMMLTAIMIVIC